MLLRRIAGILLSLAGFLGAFFGLTLAFADSTPSNEYDQFRVPWSEGTVEWRDGGCPVQAPPEETGCGAHSAYQIDFSSMIYGEAVKAISGGSLIYSDTVFMTGFGRHAIVYHENDDQGNTWDSLYGHLCSWLTFVDPNDPNVPPQPGQETMPVPISQGEWLGRAGNSGAVLNQGQPLEPEQVCAPQEGGVYVAAHLHFNVNRNSSSYNATLSGWDLQHLSDVQFPYSPGHPHPSNNSGAGYFADINYSPDMREKYLEMVDLGNSPGSTYSTTLGPCNDPSRWLHNCGEIVTQNFISSTGVPGSLTNGPVGLGLTYYYVKGPIWETYGNPANTGLLGHPLADEISCPSGAPAGCVAYQQFEGGFVWSDGTSGHAVTADLYVVSDDAAYPEQYLRWTPGGSWVTQAPTPPTQARNLKYFGNGLLFHTVNADGGLVRRSTDAGESWTSLPSPGGIWKAIGLDRTSDGTVWSVWQSSTNYMRVYSSADNGDSWTLSNEISISTGAVGSIAVHPTDPQRIAVAWVTGSASLRVRVTTNGGSSWTSYSPVSGAGIAPQIIWNGDYLIVVAHGGSTLRLLRYDGVVWTQQIFSTSSGGSSTHLGVIRGSDEGVMFAFVDRSNLIVRSTQRGEAGSWQAIGASPPGSLIQFRAIAYDADSDTLYAAWQNDRVFRLRGASTRDWGAVTANDWEPLPNTPVSPSDRGLVVMFDK